MGKGKIKYGQITEKISVNHIKRGESIKISFKLLKNSGFFRKKEYYEMI